jgi:hypothetical protein
MNTSGIMLYLKNNGVETNTASNGHEIFFDKIFMQITENTIVNATELKNGELNWKAFVNNP